MIDNKLSLQRSLLWILVSTLLISGSAFMGWLYYLHMRERRLHDDQYRIVAIIQNNPQADALKNNYLAELLDLSVDKPTNLFQFDTKTAIQKLLTNPVIKSASIKKILPGALFIDYQLRTPYAYVGDFSNTVIDEEGYLFPMHPFFTPKRLPTLYLGCDHNFDWGKCIKSESYINIAFDLLQLFAQFPQNLYKIKQLDLSQANADSYGLRQIVLVLEECGSHENQFANCTIYLRLSSEHYTQDLANFWTWQASRANDKKIPSKDFVIDLRIPHLAFINQCP